MWQVKKWETEESFNSSQPPKEIVDIDGNQLENVGINELFTILCSASSGTKYDNTNSYLGVGESTDAFDATDTDLQGSSKVWVAMDATFPTYGTSQKAIWQSTFGSAVANQAWEEFAVGNASDGGDILNRKVVSLGTKSVGQVWVLTLTVTLS